MEDKRGGAKERRRREGEEEGGEDGMKFSRFLQFLQFSLERAVSNSFTDYITVVTFIVLDEYSVLQQLCIPKGL